MKQLLFGVPLYVLALGHALAAEPPRLDHRWEHEPNLEASWLFVPTPPTPVLHGQRFSSPVASVRLAEAQLAIRHANNPSLEGRDESFPSLLKQLELDQHNRKLQLTLAAAAIALSDASRAELLWSRLSGDRATRHLIERALIDWRSPVALESWRQRLSQPTTDQFELLLAIEGVGACGGQADRPALEALFRNDQFSIATKQVIGRALARVSPQDLEGLAQDVLAADIDHRELLAAELLSQHASDAARDILLQILDADSHSAQYVAYATIAAQFPELARQQAQTMLSRNDNNIRLTAIAVLNRYDDADSLNLQAIGITDANSQVRNTVRENLLRKAELPQLRTVVDEVITTHLTGAHHQGIEQAIFMSVALDESNRCPQLLALLEHPRIEISLTAAWGLQALANTPDVAESIFEFTQPITQRLEKSEHVSLPEILRQSYLFEALGRNAYQPALETLKIYIPKNGHKMGDLARTSAIWAIGKIMLGSQDSGVAKQLAARMLDESVNDPEADLVKFTSTIALAWIAAPESVEQIQSVGDRPPSPIGLAREWSLQQFENP